MQIELTPDEESRLAAIATHEGTTATSLVKAAAMKILRDDDAFRAAVLEGIAAADRGDFVSDEEVWANVARIVGVSEDERFREAVAEGIAAADRGELIPHKEVVAHMERLFAER